MDVKIGDYFDALMFWAVPALTAAERLLRDDVSYSPWPNRTLRNTMTDHERTAEGAMMLLALRNVLRAAEWAVEGLRGDLGADIEDVMVQFHRYMPGLVEARNALEHFDEYAMGRGRLQRADPIAFGFELVQDPAPVVVVGPIRIDVEQARDACRWLIVSVLARFEQAILNRPDSEPDS